MDWKWDVLKLLPDNNVFAVNWNWNFGIGTEVPWSKLTVSWGDIETTDAWKWIILKSSWWNRYRIVVDDSGNLSTEAV